MKPSARRLAKRVSAVLVAQALVLFGGCADRLLLYPTRGALQGAESMERREVRVADGLVEVWIARSRPAESAAVRVLAFDGNASRAEYCAARLASLFADRSAEIWAVNYPGFGGSSGGAALDAMAPAGIAAYDALAGADAGAPVVLYGNSIGCTVALHVAANRPAAGVLLQNPPPLRRVIVQRHGWWNLWLLALPVALAVPGDLDAVEAAARVSAPAVFVTSQDDEVIPASYQDHVFEAYAGPKERLFTSGGHNDAVSGATVERIRAATRAMFR